MRNNMVFTKNTNKPDAPDELLKTTTLLYLKEALGNQEFEQCAALIKTAKRFGATKVEVQKVLREHVKRGNAGPEYEADLTIGGRLQFLKEE